MLIAREIRKTNIAEYIIYMWQIEDLIRAYKFDIEAIDKNIISRFEQSDEVKKQIKLWYEGLIEIMYKEELTLRGHIQPIKNIMADLTDLHLFLLKSSFHLDYRSVYQDTSMVLIEFHSKMGEKNKTEVDVCFEALYSILLLKLQKKDISIETMDAVKKISALVALLSKKYHEHEKDLLKM
jgi:hypothetical protein